MPNTSDALTLISLKPSQPQKENVTAFEWKTMFFFYLVVVQPALTLLHKEDLLQGSPSNWLLPGLMAMVAVMIYVQNRTSEHPYKWWSALILALMGSVVFWVKVPLNLYVLLPMLLSGLWFLVQGGVTLVYHLHENPYPQIPESARL